MSGCSRKVSSFHSDSGLGPKVEPTIVSRNYLEFLLTKLFLRVIFSPSALPTPTFLSPPSLHCKPFGWRLLQCQSRELKRQNLRWYLHLPGSNKIYWLNWAKVRKQVNLVPEPPLESSPALNNSRRGLLTPRNLFCRTRALCVVFGELVNVFLKLPM